MKGESVPLDQRRTQATNVLTIRGSDSAIQRGRHALSLCCVPVGAPPLVTIWNMVQANTRPSQSSQAMGTFRRRAGSRTLEGPLCLKAGSQHRGPPESSLVERVILAFEERLQNIIQSTLNFQLMIDSHGLAEPQTFIFDLDS